MSVDWIIHFIPCTPQPSFHTHGLDRHNSLELELNLALKPKQAMQFINLIAMDMVKTGKRYQSGDREDDVFNLPFYLFETNPIQPSRPGDRVLRILFCDPDNKYPWEEGCQPPYSDQLNPSEAAAMRALLERKKGVLS